MTKQDVIERLCKMMTRVWSNLDPNAQRPCDCVCRETGMRYQNSGEALEFMERAVSDALARRAAVSGSGEKVACCACTAVFIETGTASGCPDHRAPDSVSTPPEVERLRALLVHVLLDIEEWEGGRGGGSWATLIGIKDRVKKELESEPSETGCVALTEQDRAEFERPVEMADAELRAMGVDPDELGKRGAAFVENLKRELSCGSHSSASSSPSSSSGRTPSRSASTGATGRRRPGAPDGGADAE